MNDDGVLPMANGKDLNNSRPLDVHRWSEHPEVNQFVQTIWLLIESQIKTTTRGRPQRAPQKKQFKVLLLDLYLCWQEDPEQSLGVHMSASGYKENSRYNALHISSKTIQIVQALHQEGLIDWHKGSEAARRVTRIWPTDKLVQYFQRTTFKPQEIIIQYKQECIILNDQVVELRDDEEVTLTKAIEYSDDDHRDIYKWRSDLEAYNSLLERSYVDIWWLKGPWIKRTTKKGKTVRQRIDQNHKFVRRVFYRGSWELGGRFHGGWWQQVGSTFRKGILINDSRTVEVDYSGMHVSIAYALEGHQPPEDPYTLPLKLKGYTAQEQRALVKGLVLMAINAQTLPKAYAAFRAEQPKGSKQRKITNIQLQDMISLFLDHHPMLLNYIGRDKGVELMRIDGNITARVINHFTSQGIPVLTVHDSYIVNQEHDTTLMDQMNRAASKELGTKINLKAEGLGKGQTIALNNMERMDAGTNLNRLLQLKKLDEEIERTKEYQERLQIWLQNRP